MLNKVLDIVENDVEVKKEIVVYIIIVGYIERFIEYYLDWIKFRWVVVWMIRFKVYWR